MPLCCSNGRECYVRVFRILSEELGKEKAMDVYDATYGLRARFTSRPIYPIVMTLISKLNPYENTKFIKS